MPTPKTPSTDMEAVLTGKQELRLRDPEDASLAIVDRILNAQTAEDVLTQAGTLSADDILGQGFKITELEFLRSAYEQGSPVYALVQVVMLESGETALVTIGGRNAVAQLARLKQLDALDRPLKVIRTERPTSNGFYPMWLQAVD